MKVLTPELKKEQVRVEKMAKDYGLDFFPTIFEMITYDQMSEFASQGGFPFVIRTGVLEWNTKNFLKAMNMGFQKFMKWSLTPILVMPIS